MLTGTVSADPEPSPYQNSFTLTANFIAPANGPAITGIVTFTVDGTIVGTGIVNNNSAKFTITAPPYAIGSHVITATYPGDFNYNPLVLTGSHQITKLRSTISLQVLTTVIYYGQTADAVAQVGALDTSTSSSLNGGTITFYADGSNIICQLTVTGQAQTCPTSAGTGFAAGTHTLYATYSGNSDYDPSVSSTGSFTVIPDDTTAALTSSLNPSTFGNNVTFSAKVSAQFAVPTGPVNFFDGATLIGTGVLDATGAATVDVSSLAVGTHTIKAVYPATQNFLGSTTASIQQVVVQRPSPPLTTVTLLNSSVNPSVLGQSVTFTASVATTGAFLSTPTGAVTFLDGSTKIGTGILDATGRASFSTSALALGQHPITAVFAGPSDYAASTSAVLTQAVVASLTSAGNGFLLSVTPTTLNVAVGTSAGVTVTVLPLNGFNQAVQLSCVGQPDEGYCDFGAPTLPPVGGSTRLLISATAPHSCDSSTPYFTASNGGSGFSVLAAASVLCFARRKRKLSVRALALLLGLSLLPMLGGCGASCTDLGVKPGNYTFTVQGKSEGSSPVTHTVTIRMNVHL